MREEFLNVIARAMYAARQEEYMQGRLHALAFETPGRWLNLSWDQLDKAVAEKAIATDIQTLFRLEAEKAIEAFAGYVFDWGEDGGNTAMLSILYDMRKMIYTAEELDAMATAVAPHGRQDTEGLPALD